MFYFHNTDNTKNVSWSHSFIIKGNIFADFYVVSLSLNG